MRVIILPCWGIFLFIMGCSVVAEPSAIDVATRKQELQQRAELLGPTTEALKPYSDYCEGLIEPLKTRAKVLQDTESFAVIKDAQEGGFSEQYKLQQEMLDFIDDLEEAQQKCIAEHETLRATEMATLEAQHQKLATIDALRTSTTSGAIQEKYSMADKALVAVLTHENLPSGYGETVCTFMEKANYDSRAVHHVMATEWGSYSLDVPNADGFSQGAVVSVISTLELHLGKDLEGWCQSRFS